jgi:hypothetical protein
MKLVETHVVVLDSHSQVPSTSFSPILPLSADAIDTTVNVSAVKHSTAKTVSRRRKSAIHLVTAIRQNKRCAVDPTGLPPGALAMLEDQLLSLSP